MESALGLKTEAVQYLRLNVRTELGFFVTFVERAYIQPKAYIKGALCHSLPCSLSHLQLRHKEWS